MRSLLICISLFTVALLTTACEGLFTKEKTPLPGKRLALFTEESNLKVIGPHNAINLPHSQVNKEWPQAGFNAEHLPPILQLAKNPILAWKTSVGEGSSPEQKLVANLAVSQGLVYALDVTGKLTVLRLSDGEILWQRDTIVGPEASDIITGGGLAVYDERLYVTTGLGTIICYDLKGNEQWSQNISSPIRSAPTIDQQGRIFLTTINNEIYAISSTGKIIWNHAGFPEATGLLGGGSPAVKGNTVIVAYSSGEVFALTADSGEPLWTDTLIAASQVEGVSSLPHIRARPIIIDKIVYVVSNGGRIAAIDLLTGVRIWYKDFGGMRTPAVGGNYLFLITNQEQLVCVNRSNGDICWAVNLPQELNQHINWAGPVLTSEGLVVYGSNGQVLFISPTTGQILKNLEVKAPLFMSPVIANQYLLAFTDQAEVIAWRPSN